MHRPNHKILLISEAPVAKNAGGISQTLFNLFEGYPKEKLLVLSSEEDIKSWSGNEVSDFNIIGFKKRPYKPLLNRLGRFINPSINYINFSILDLNAKAYQQITAFSPTLIIICANGTEGLILGQKILKKFNVPFAVYFMDDWFNTRQQKWWNGDLQNIVIQLLSKAAGWIMISSYLQKVLELRYGLVKRTLIAHNPVDIWEEGSQPGINHSNEIRIAYAGSLWPMHLDAFRLVAQACKILRSKGIKATLHMFGPSIFYENNKAVFIAEEVMYEGKVVYDKLYPSLKPFDLLLVCSSFEQEHAPFSISSVQTKITDYMNIGQPILSVGPIYSACNLYIKANNIGFTFENPDAEALSDYLIKIQHDIESRTNYMENARTLIINSYNKNKVQHDLYNFTESLK